MQPQVTLGYRKSWASESFEIESLVETRDPLDEFIMSFIPGRIELESDVPLQCRRAQEVDPEFARAVQRVCEQCRQVSACYLLDARRPDTGEMALIIALTVDDEAQDMYVAAQRFQAMLHQFPAQAPKTFIMSSSSFVESYAGAELYSRRAV
jgi:hypothetical protein